MFGKKENDMAKNNGNSAVGGLNSINSLSKGTSIQGSIKTENDIRIDGVLNGDVECNGKLIIGPSGVIEGKANCTNAVIEGKIQGIITVKELLHVKDSAVIEGDIYTDKLIIDNNARFNGKCQMGGQVIAEGFSKPKIEKVG
jgi:cytoskeletal protein CcmA (bactofilin family)